MSSKAVEKALNDQVRKEFYSAYIYLSMSAYFESKALGGFAGWMRRQYEEEIEHAMKIYDHMLDNDLKVELQALEKPPVEFGTPLETMKEALAHEQHITKSIIDLYELAVAEKDYPTQILLQWFISEQTEEEKMVGDIVAHLEIAGDNAPALLMMDQQLGSRKPEGSEA